MKIKYVLLLITSMSFLAVGLPKNIQKKVEAEIKSTFNVDAFKMTLKLIEPEVATALPSEFNTDNFFEIKKAEQRIGFAYISKAPSKTDEFDYLILLDKSLTVVKAKVLVYREDYGGEIGSKRWLQQFIGKTQHDELRYQENIIAISGATISVRSMTNAVNDLLKSLKILHSKHIL